MEATDNSNKQYSLRWEKHAFNLATEAGYFFEDESFLDCTLSAEGQCIKAHKIILSASSSYLSSLLKMSPDKHPILIFNDIKFEQLKSIVAFIYNGSVNVSESNIHDFLNAAQSLLIKGLYEGEFQDGSKTSENLKRVYPQELRQGPRKILPKTTPVIRKPEQQSDPLKLIKRHRSSLVGNKFAECEENLSKLQEISFTKYINQNLNTVGNDLPANKWNGPVDEKTKSPENYVVKSWKHNSVEDLNGRHKIGKNRENHLFKKFKLEKPREEQNPTEIKNKLSPEKTETEPDKSSSEDLDDGIKKEPEIEQIMLVEPKQELMEEDDTNSDPYDNGQTTGSDTMTSEPETIYDGRSMPPYYQHPIVGIPVPLLMCKTSLSEPDSSESNWMPSSAISSENPPHQLTSIDNSQDLQCRTCSQDLPCPTCTKKYKSRYALNRHILYECGKARKSFSCDECGKKVTRQDTLQKHKLIHLVQHLKEQESEGEKPESVKIKKKC